ncbi:MAG: MFS transporter [Dehalococcoidia bacterium]|nr:MFS transporter [Dehalococcoidia bacterium]MSQ16012.1 MFS transporter [Dehalococcoidia bacterium]
MFVINFAGMATGNLTLGLFVIPVGAELGMSRAAFGWLQTTRRVSSGVTSFVVGRVLDRYGPRGLVVVSAVIIGGCLLAISRIHSSWQFMVLFGIMGLTGLAAPNSLVTTVPVAKWFRRRRGKALALATMGSGIGGIIFLPVTQWLLGGLGWRTTWIVMGIIFVVIVVPVAFIFLRRQPEDLGLRVDGDPPREPVAGVSASGGRPEVEEAAWTVRQALHTSAFWKLLAVFAAAGLAQGSAGLHRIPYWVEKGFDPQIVAFAFAADAGGAATMAFIAGMLVDKFPVRFVGAASYLGFVAAMLLMLVGRNELFLFGSTIVYGLSVGAGMILQSYIFANYFGRAFLGSIRGIVMPVTLVAAGIGGPLSGYLRDASGSYASSWWLIIGLCLASAVLLATAKPPVLSQAASPPGVAG